MKEVVGLEKIVNPQILIEDHFLCQRGIRQWTEPGASNIQMLLLVPALPV